MSDTSGAGVSASEDLGSRLIEDEDTGKRRWPEIVFVDELPPDERVPVVTYRDTPPGRFMPQPVVIHVEPDAVPDWDERYWHPLR